MPARMPSKVDLPEPLGPMRAIHSPGLTWKEMFWRTGSACLSSMRVREMALTRSTDSTMEHSLSF